MKGIQEWPTLCAMHLTFESFEDLCNGHDPAHITAKPKGNLNENLSSHQPQGTYAAPDAC